MIFSQRIGIRCAAIIIVLIITQSRADDVTDKQISYRYLSELQSEYFTKIPKWWLSISEIDGGHASNEYLRQLVDEHREYMFKPSREQLKLTYYRTYLLLNIEHYNDNITVIYNTLKENYNYLFDEKAAESNLFDVNQLTTWAQSEKIESMKHHLQSLFDITFQPNAIYKHIQKVSHCCTLNACGASSRSLISQIDIVLTFCVFRKRNAANGTFNMWSLRINWCANIMEMLLSFYCEAMRWSSCRTFC